ncbi:MAG: DUF4867 family protein [Synergistaceae bacterium]|jgi:hypothetical protein|nr:DUF4867 family protein [Synergistaceae bacterium]
MKLQHATDVSFSRYGMLLEGYDFSEILKVLRETTEKPADKVAYVAGEPALEKLAVAGEIMNRAYGGMPIQVGYCNGSNVKLNCFEYHRGSEVSIVADDVIILLAPKQEIKNNSIDTASVEAFLVPAGSAVLLYETTLHYAPCNALSSSGFRVALILPKNTNIGKPDISVKNDEDKLLFNTNKWLLAHQDSPEAKIGAVVGITGPNIEVSASLFN